MGKECFTTTSHVEARNLLTWAFQHFQQHAHQTNALLAADPQYLATLARVSLDAWFRIESSNVLTSCEALSHTLFGIGRVFQEMRLLPEARAGQGGLPRPRDAAPSPTPEKRAFTSLLQTFAHRPFITVTDANNALSCRKAISVSISTP